MNWQATGEGGGVGSAVELWHLVPRFASQASLSSSEYRLSALPPAPPSPVSNHSPSKSPVSPGPSPTVVPLQATDKSRRPGSEARTVALVMVVSFENSNSHAGGARRLSQWKSRVPKILSRGSGTTHDKPVMRPGNPRGSTVMSYCQGLRRGGILPTNEAFLDWLGFGWRWSRCL